jgi:hypothetical protein
MDVALATLHVTVTTVGPPLIVVNAFLVTMATIVSPVQLVQGVPAPAQALVYATQGSLVPYVTDVNEVRALPIIGY